MHKNFKPDAFAVQKQYRSIYAQYNQQTKAVNAFTCHFCMYRRKKHKNQSEKDKESLMT